MHEFPTPPAIESDIVRQLIQYAQACAAWLEADLREARAHNHGPSPEQQSNLDGYRFTAVFLEESYHSGHR